MPDKERFLREMVANTQAKVEKMNGFEAPQIAEPVDVKNFNYFADPWNPLFNDPEYAAHTKYGRIPAFPSFFEWLCDSVHLPSIDPEGGFAWGSYAGENFELFSPIYPGDTLRVFHEPSHLTDMTDAAKAVPQEYLTWPKQFPIYAWDEQNIKVYNQDDVLVADFHHKNDIAVYDSMDYNLEIEKKLPFEDHKYTADEWDFINSVIAGEKIRGAEPRYWEDVHPGDEITPTTVGPTTIWDMICHLARCAMPKETPLHPLRRQRELSASMPVDSVTNNYKHFIGMHIWDPTQSALGGMPRPFHFGNYGRNVLLRGITNWMGDDADIRKFRWRHMRMTPIGDCTVTYGRVLDKKIENGEALVEIEVWLENMCRGNITEAGRAWVKLPTRNPIETLTAEDKPIRYNNSFKPGDKVIIKDRSDRKFPTGYPLAGRKAEVISAFAPWHLFYIDFDGYVPVRLTDPEHPFDLGEGMFIREGDLELE